MYKKREDKKNLMTSIMLILIIIALILFMNKEGIINININNNNNNNNNNNTIIAKSIVLSENEIGLKVNGTRQLTVKISPDNTTNKSVVWESSNSNIATVNSNGLVKAINIGQAIITVKTVDGNVKSQCKVVVSKEAIEPTEINFSDKNIKLKVNEEKVLSYQILPKNANISNFKFTSSNSSIVSVNNTGIIKGIKKGNATITMIVNNKIRNSINITVEDNAVLPNKINMIQAITLDTGSVYKLNVEIEPRNATNKSVVYSSSNPSVVSVDSNGIIVGLKEGTSTITVKTHNNITSTCLITVKNKNIPLQSIAIKNISPIYVGDSKKLELTFSPSNATNKSVVYSSSNPGVVSVDSNGNIAGLKAGTSIITVKSGSVENKITITVNLISFNWSNGEEKSLYNGGGAPRIYSVNNTLIAGYEIKSSSSGKNIINTMISTDNGNTWVNSRKASFKDNLDCANINFYAYQGNLYMAYRATGTVSGKFQTYLEVSISYDNGNSWQHHSEIAHYQNSGTYGVWEPYLGVLNNKLTCFYANDSRNITSYQNIEYLVWNGTSWSNRTIISNGKKHKSRDGMPVWTRLSNGYYIAVIESSKYGSTNPFVIQALVSSDGVNWSEPVDVYIPKTKKSKAAAPGIVELPTKQIVISFQTDEDKSNKGDQYSVQKTITSTTDINDIVNAIKSGTSITNKFSQSDDVFKGSSTTWGGIYYKNNWLYIAAGGSGSKYSGSIFKRIKVK